MQTHMLHGSGQRARQPQPRPRLGDADVVWASQRQHAVENMDRHIDLGGPTLLCA